MTNQQISDSLDSLQFELFNKHEKKGLSMHEAKLLTTARRLSFVMVEKGMLDIVSRMEALLAIKGVLVSDIKNRRKKRKVGSAIAFLWDSVKTLTSQEFVAECLGVDQSTISNYYYENLRNIAA